MRRRCPGPAWTGRARPASQAGVTLLELSFVIGVILAVGALALVATDGWRALFGLTSEDRAVLEVEPRAAALQKALRDWFTTTRCSTQAPSPPPFPLGPGSVLKAAKQDLKDYAADGAAYLDDTDAHGTYTGCISRASGLPHVQLYWEPPAHLAADAMLAARLQAKVTQCPDPATTCSPTATQSCLLWDRQPAVGAYGGRDAKMLEQWLARFGITCDRNGDGDINDDTSDGDRHPDDPAVSVKPYCDSNADGSLGPNAPYDYEYHASDYYPKTCTKCLRDLDLNATSLNDFDFLDFDSDGDFDVDAVDYAYWGC